MLNNIRGKPGIFPDMIRGQNVIRYDLESKGYNSGAECSIFRITIGSIFRITGKNKEYVSAIPDSILIFVNLSSGLMRKLNIITLLYIRILYNISEPQSQ